MIYRIQSRILFPGLASAALVSSALPSCGEANCLETKTCTTTPSSTGGSSSFGAGGLNFATNPNRGEAGAAGAAPSGSGSGGEAASGSGGEAGGESGEPCSDEGERRCAAAADSTILECSDGVWVVAETCVRGELCDSIRADCATIAPGCERRAPGGAFCEDNELVVCGPDLVTVEREACEVRCARGACVGYGAGGAPSGSGGSSNTNGGSNDAGGAAGSASTDSGTGSGNEAGAPVSNPCSPSPCPADRVCVNDDPGFHCACPPGTIGASCTPVVEDLGTPPGRPRCSVVGSNVDGSVVVGACDDSVAGDAFRWTASGGFQILDDSRGPSSAYDVSADGTIVIGSAYESGDWFPFRWTAAGGMTRDSVSPQYFSDDGSAWISRSAWMTVSTNQSLSFHPIQISGSGNVVVGYAVEGDGTKAYKWTVGGSAVELPPPSGMTNAVAKCASKDGSVIGGRAEIGGQVYGVIWRGTTPESVGLTAQDAPYVTGGGIDILTDDGSAGLSSLYAYGPLYWSRSGALRPLYEALNEGGAVLADHDIYSADALSGDGRFVVGQLASRSGVFRALLPE